jgi:hypothetical protein
MEQRRRLERHYRARSDALLRAAHVIQLERAIHATDELKVPLAPQRPEAIEALPEALPTVVRDNDCGQRGDDRFMGGRVLQPSCVMVVNAVPRSGPLPHEGINADDAGL